MYFLSSWISFTGNLIGLHLGIWEFPSPLIGRNITELLYDLFSLPFKAIMITLFLKPSLPYNAIMIAFFTGLTVLWEWAALKYSTLIVYSDYWSILGTYIFGFVVFSLIAYLFQKKVL